MKIGDVTFPVGMMVRIDCDPKPSYGVVYGYSARFLKVLTEGGRHRDCFRMEVIPQRTWSWMERDYVTNGSILERGQYCITCRGELARSESVQTIFRHMDNGMAACLEVSRQKFREKSKAKRDRALPGTVEVETFAGIRRIVTQK